MGSRWKIYTGISFLDLSWYSIWLVYVVLKLLDETWLICIQALPRLLVVETMILKLHLIKNEMSLRLNCKWGILWCTSTMIPHTSRLEIFDHDLSLFLHCGTLLPARFWGKYNTCVCLIIESYCTFAIIELTHPNLLSFLIHSCQIHSFKYWPTSTKQTWALVPVGLSDHVSS